MGRPRKNPETEPANPKPAKAPKVEEPVPALNEFLDTVPFDDLDVVGPLVQDISMQMRPAIVTEDHLKEEKTKEMPDNTVVPVIGGKVKSVVPEVVLPPHVLSSLEGLSSFKTDMESLKEYMKQVGTAPVAPPPDLTMFKAWQDMANKKFVDLSTSSLALDNKLTQLIEDNKVQVIKINTLQATVESLTATVIDFLDALNQKKVMVSTSALVNEGIAVDNSKDRVNPPFPGPYKELPTIVSSPLQEEEEDVVEAEVVLLSPEEELLRKFPAIAQGNPDALRKADERLPGKVISTIKASPHIATPKAWSNSFAPKIKAKFTDPATGKCPITENDLFTFLVKLNALDEQGNIDPTKL